VYLWDNRDERRRKIQRRKLLESYGSGCCFGVLDINGNKMQDGNGSG
jgi:hypothetical protein